VSEKRRLLKNTATTGAALTVQLAAALVLMPFLIRSFGVAGYGLYMLATSVSSYGSLLDLGVGSSLVKLVAEKRATNEHGSIERLISSGLAFYVLAGLVAALALASLAGLAGHVFHLTASESMTVRNLLLAAAAVSLFSWPLSTGYHVLGGLQRYDLIARNQVLQTVGATTVGIATILFARGPLFLLVGQSVVSLAAAALNAGYAYRELGRPRISPARASKQSIRQIMSFSWAVFVAQLCLVVLYSQTDRVVLGVFVGATAIGLYEAAGKFQSLIGQLASWTNTAVMPATSQFSAEGRKSMVDELFIRGTRYVTALVCPIVVLIIVLARPIIVNWLGSEFEGVVLAAQILSSYALLTIGTSVGDNIAVGLGRLPKRIPYIIAITLGNLVLSVTLVQRLGIMGVVLGTAIPWYVELPTHIRFLVREIGVPFRRWFREAILPTYALLPIPALMGWAAIRVGLTPGLWQTAVVALVCLCTYWGLVYRLGFTTADRHDISAAATRTAAALGFSRARVSDA
jgi:O-antigen/teichoic acid export membrane protein